MGDGKIAVCLSGGGVRALVFHLGVLDYLARKGFWNRLAIISTVSGGTLATALIFEFAGQRWPTAEEYVDMQPKIQALLTSWDLEGAYRRRLWLNPWLLVRGRAYVIAKLLRKHWNITGNVNQMPDHPRWIINTTCYETGKNFRFMLRRMGDYLTGYVLRPDFPLAEAVAASAAVPGLIGPLVLRTRNYKWVKFDKAGISQDSNSTTEAVPVAKRLQLWDGGVYENLAMEAVLRPGKGLREGVDIVLVSDASRPLGIELARFKWGIPPYIAPVRLVDIATDQVWSLRVRMLREFLSKNPTSGVYVRMGRTAEEVYEEQNRPMAAGGARWLQREEVERAASHPTTLRRLAQDEFRLLHAHGHEAAGAAIDG